MPSTWRQFDPWVVSDDCATIASVRIGSLFSGYGGLDLAVQSVLGGNIAWHVEYDKAPSRILDHHWPDVPNYGDVTQLDFTTVEPVDVLTGGYPCQPFSHAGMRKGTNDERHLWPHVLRAIRDLGPRLAVLENVRGHLSLGFDVVLADLADIGWSAEWVVVRASDAGACHQRARLFILAYPDGQRVQGNRCSGPQGRRQSESHGIHGYVADAAGNRRPQGWTGPGEWAGCCGQPACDCGAPADATGAGSRREPRDFSAAPRAGAAKPAAHRRSNRGAAGSGGSPTAHASRERHGRGQDAGMVGRLGTTTNVVGRQASPARSVAGNRGAADVADAGSVGRYGWQSLNRDGWQEGIGSQASNYAGNGGISWGDYGPAIDRWETVIGRPAPAPTEPGRTGAPRLAPRFVEWMMGLPDGWVTDSAIGISRNDQLKALGNGVVPQQAALALDVLLQRTSDDFRQAFAPL